jgi:hypothetical protein
LKHPPFKLECFTGNSTFHNLQRNLQVFQHIPINTTRAWVSVYLTLDTQLFGNLKFKLDGFSKISLISSDQIPKEFKLQFSLSNEEDKRASFGTRKFILYDEYKKFIEKGTFTIQVKISFSSENLLESNMGMKYKDLMENKSDEEIILYYKQLKEDGKDFNSQLESKDNQIFPIHKELVSLSCAFFKNLLGGEFTEGNHIQIENANKNTLKSLLGYIYTNEINIENILEMNELFEFSDFICCTELVERLKFQIESIKILKI